MVPIPTRLPKSALPPTLSTPPMVEEEVTESTEVVAEIVLMPANWLVDDALIPWVKRIRVEVELTGEKPKEEAPEVKSNDPPAVA